MIQKPIPPLYAWEAARQSFNDQDFSLCSFEILSRLYTDFIIIGRDRKRELRSTSCKISAV